MVVAMADLVVVVVDLLAAELDRVLLVAARSSDRALFMLASRRVMVRVIHLLAVQSQRTLALAMLAMVNLVMAMMRRLPVMRMVNLALAVQVHSHLLLLGIASDKNFIVHRIVEAGPGLGPSYGVLPTSSHRGVVSWRRTCGGGSGRPCCSGVCWSGKHGCDGDSRRKVSCFP